MGSRQHAELCERPVITVHNSCIVSRCLGVKRISDVIANADMFKGFGNSVLFVRSSKDDAYDEAKL